MQHFISTCYNLFLSKNEDTFNHPFTSQIPCSSYCPNYSLVLNSLVLRTYAAHLYSEINSKPCQWVNTKILRNARLPILLISPTVNCFFCINQDSTVVAILKSQWGNRHSETHQSHRLEISVVLECDSFHKETAEVPSSSFI